MKNKLFYTQPTTDFLELRSEGIICGSIILQVFGETGEAGGNPGFDNGDNNYGEF